MDYSTKELKMKNLQCECLEIRPEGAFESLYDLKNLEKNIIKADNLNQIPLGKEYYNVGGQEKWFSCKICQRIWMLAYPDPPFRGYWKTKQLQNNS